jgi:hypothetical protein
MLELPLPMVELLEPLLGLGLLVLGLAVVLPLLPLVWA